MAKIDVAHAYRNVPIHPQDRWLLGMQWEERVYIDTVLPFGLRSAPKIFCALSDALEWVLNRRQVNHVVKYIDDFLIVGPPRSDQCARDLVTTIETCAELGLPLSLEKREGPTTVIEFLGIELDTQLMEIRLPEKKLVSLRQELERWTSRRACTKRQLLSLIGRLAHACKVVPPGRTFLRRMVDLSMKPKKLHHWVRLTEDFRSDLEWWKLFVSSWNGVGMITPRMCKTIPDEVVHTDASGWGCGGIWKEEWFQYRWPKEWEQRAIAVRELLPVVVACVVWGAKWTHKWVLVKTDNQSVVDILKSRSSKNPMIMHMVRCIQFVLASFQFELQVEHIQGVRNVAADALSRGSLQVFQLSIPTANPRPVTIPPVLEQMLIQSSPDWLSQSWRRMLTTICKWEWPRTQQRPTGQHRKGT